jgi:hypothetical protein
MRDITIRTIQQDKNTRKYSEHDDRPSKTAIFLKRSLTAFCKIIICSLLRLMDAKQHPCQIIAGPRPFQ